MMCLPRSLSFSEHSVQGLCTFALSLGTEHPHAPHSLVGRIIQPLALHTPNPACKAQTPSLQPTVTLSPPLPPAPVPATPASTR